MKRELLKYLRCPRTGAELALEAPVFEGDDVRSGTLRAPAGESFPVHAGIPRFVPPDNYATSFGLQWNHFRRTQLDSYSGVPISRERFFRYSGWRPESMRGKLALDAGCGAGRFAEVALDAGAEVVAVDYSNAVDACKTNLEGRSGLHPVQADIFALPLARESFDFVYSFGVLQHTPDPARAFRSLLDFLKPGGMLAVDVYPLLLRHVFWSKYWLRPLTRRVAPERLFALVQKSVPALLPVSRAVGSVPLIGRKLRFLIPVANYEGIYDLTPAQIHEWAVLDTYDMLAPAHDHPQTMRTVRGWLDESALEQAEVERIGFIVARGRKPDRAA